jgi:hypothetical protein
MSKMTITHAELEAARQIAEPIADSDGYIERMLQALGITIAESEPPEAMVKLAREIVQDVPSVTGGYVDMQNAALAALQHAVDVVKGAKRVGDIAGSGSLIVRAHILTALGAP